MNGYVCYYRGRRVEVEANSSYEAQKIAAEKLGIKPKDRHYMGVVLAEKDGKQVTHKPDF